MGSRHVWPPQFCPFLILQRRHCFSMREIVSLKWKWEVWHWLEIAMQPWPKQIVKNEKTYCYDQSSPSAWCGIDTFAKTDGGVFFEFGCSSEIDLNKKGSTSPRWRSNRFSPPRKKWKRRERKFCTQVSPIGRKVGEQWAIRLQKLPKLAPTSMEIADASDNQPFLGLISKIGTNFGLMVRIANDSVSGKLPPEICLFWKMWLFPK